MMLRFVMSSRHTTLHPLIVTKRSLKPKNCGMTRKSLENYRKLKIMVFGPAITIMNRLQYSQKFVLISLLFILPLALVLNFLLLELDSRNEFTQQEIYGQMEL